MTGSNVTASYIGHQWGMLSQKVMLSKLFFHGQFIFNGFFCS